MTPELLVLLAASMVALQIVSLILRREHVEDSPYLALLVIDLAVLGFAHATHRHESMVAFVAEGAAAVLTLAPRLLDLLERAALGRDDFRRAARVALVRELIVPGRTMARRRRQLDNLAEARAGNGSQVVRRLRAEIDLCQDPLQALALREELATVLFFDLRFAEGVVEVERHLGIEHVARRPTFAAYLLRAYGETGQLDRAAQVMSLLEDGPIGRDPAAATLIAQARLTFLAFSGQVAHVEALLAGEAGHSLPDRAHDFLLDVARTRSTGTMYRPPAELPPEVRALAETVFRRASMPGLAAAARPPRRARATYVLVLTNLIVFAALVLLPGPGDEGTLVRAGALFRPAVAAGEWWRLFTGMFLHAGWMHLGINMYGLFLLGRFTEEVFGSARYLAVYLLAGLGGAVASTLLGAGALSVGASGAIMGLLGALIVTLVLRRGSWPEVWRKTLLWNLLLLGAMQIYIGFQVAMIDNAAHVGGMVTGAAATLLLAPGGVVPDTRTGRGISVALALLLALGAVTSLVLTVRRPLATTLANVATHEVETSNARLVVPTYWELDANEQRVEDPYLDVRVVPRIEGDHVRIDSPQHDDPRYRALIDRIAATAKKRSGL